MARSQSPAGDRRDRDRIHDRSRDRDRTPARKRDRSRSPRDAKGQKRRRSSSRDRRRSRSPRKDGYRSRPSPAREPRRRTRSPRPDPRDAKKEDGELIPRHENGARHRTRSPERVRRRSRSREAAARSRSRERRRSHSRDRTAVGDRDKRATEPLETQERANGAPNGTSGVTEAKGAKKSEPLSLEEFMKKKKQEEEEQAKVQPTHQAGYTLDEQALQMISPVRTTSMTDLAPMQPKFLSKKQREELALQRLKGESDAKQRRVEEAKSSHDPYKSVADRQREEKRRVADRKLEEDRRRLKDEQERAKELELIKNQYLGTEKVKKKIRKPSEKFHLNFDWEVADDTSRDLNPIYNNTHEAALLFGSGKRAGVDMQEQRKLAAEHQRQLLRKMREAQGLKETKQDRERDRERQRLAEAFDGLDSKNVVKEHWSEKRREDMTERDWRIFREDFNISYKGVHVSGAALPIRNWEEAGLPTTLMKAINDLGYKAPSPIQMASIPLGMMQRDVIGVAETGSGKTAAFVLPMLCYLMKQPEMTEEIAAEGPYAVVMAPVRELAQQIEEETMKLAKHTPYRTVSVVGGQDINEQAFKLRKGCEIVIATPGRLLDCVEQSFAVLNQCNYVVLDEADRMIDLGFEPQVIGVLDAMPSSNLKPEGEDDEAASSALEADRVYRTTYMFSATMPPPVERLARKYLRRPAVINIGSAGKATDNVTQKVYMVKDNEKLGVLERELELINEKRAIVFVNTKRSCDIVSRHLDVLEYQCTVLHGGKTQDQRELSLQGFREEKYNVLVATDVAGRGIDVPNVALVVNYDMPAQIEQYTHRIGRTARAGRKGVAVTLLTAQDTDIYFDLKKLLEESKAAVPPQLAHHEAARQRPGTISDRPRRDAIQYAKK